MTHELVADGVVYLFLTGVATLLLCGLTALVEAFVKYKNKGW